MELKGVPLSVRIRSGTAILLHQGVADPIHFLMAEVVDCLAVEHKPAERIGDSERVTALPIAAFKTAFENPCTKPDSALLLQLAAGHKAPYDASGQT